MKSLWVDNGSPPPANRDTLLYSEFTRSRPEANNVLLTSCRKKILNMPKLRSFGEGCLEVHPDFRRVFTSNLPEEYAEASQEPGRPDGTGGSPSGMGHYDRETEIKISR